MIKTMLHIWKTGDTRWGDENLISEWAGDPDVWVWADFSDEDPSRENELFELTFRLHPLAIADAQRDRHPPKLEVFDNHFFLLMNGLDATTTDINFKPSRSHFL